MPQPEDIDDDDVELVPVPMDRAMRVLLVGMSRQAGKHPTELAAALLRDTLVEDALAHGVAIPDLASPVLN